MRGSPLPPPVAWCGCLGETPLSQRSGVFGKRILVTVDGFGAAIWKKCAQSQGFGLSVSGTGGKWGIPYGGGGGGR